MKRVFLALSLLLSPSYTCAGSFSDSAVLVGVHLRDGYYANCSGVVVAKRRVLTTASCVQLMQAPPKRYSPFKIYVDKTHILDANLQLRHAHFDGSSYRVPLPANSGTALVGSVDLAVLATAEDIPLTPAVVASSYPIAGEMLTLVGFGSTLNTDSPLKSSRPVSTVLGLPAYYRTRGLVQMGALLSTKAVSGSLLGCYGDSGAPLFNSAGQLVAIHALSDRASASCSSTSSNTAVMVSPYSKFASGNSDMLFQNTLNRLDINNDGSVTSIDLLDIINNLNANGTRSLSNESLKGLYLDPTGDGWLTSLDVLNVSNALNFGAYLPDNKSFSSPPRYGGPDTGTSLLRFP